MVLRRLKPLITPAILIIAILMGSCESDILINLEDDIKEQVYTAPGIPQVTSGAAVTNNRQPKWEWTIPSGATQIEYQLNTQTEGNWMQVEIDITSYTPDQPLEEGSYTLYVRARGGKNNGLLSPVSSFSITVDLSATEKPVITGLVITNNVTPTWTWTVPEGAVGFRYQIGGPLEGQWKTAALNNSSYTPLVHLFDGTHILYVQAVNYLGTWSESASFATQVDTNSPDPLTIYGDSETVDTQPTWSWSFSTSDSDVVGGRYSLDTTLVNQYNWVDFYDRNVTSFTPTAPLVDDTYYLSLQVRDAAGNLSDIRQKSIRVDTTAPVIGSGLVSDETPVKSKIWSWSSDDDPNAYYRYIIDTTAAAPASWGSAVWSKTSSATIGGVDGDYYLHVQAKDSLDNMGPVKTVKAVLQNIAPDAPVVSSEANYTTNRRPEWTWTVPDGAISFQYRLDDKLWTNSEGAISFVPGDYLTEGSHILYVKASNSLSDDGLWSAANSKTVVVDTVPPTVHAGNDISWTRTTANLEGFLEDDTTNVSAKWEQLSGSGTVVFDNSSNGSTTVTGPAGVESSYELQLTGTDQAANQSSDTLLFYWDDKAPAVGNSGAITITDVNSSSVTVSWTQATDLSTNADQLQYKVVYSTSDNISTVADAQLITDGRIIAMDWLGGTTSKQVLNLTSGLTYYFTVLVKDSLGNIGKYEVRSKALTGVGGFNLTLVSPDEADITFSESDDITVNQADSLTVSITETFDSYEWSLYGLDLSSETTNTVTISGASLEPGVHTLTFYGMKNGKLYSKNLTFTIIN